MKTGRRPYRVIQTRVRWPVWAGLSAVCVFALASSICLAQIQNSWSESDKRTLQIVLGHAEEEALDPNAYALPTAPTDEEITEVALSYLNDLRNGRSALRNIDSDIQLPMEAADLRAGLQAARKSHALKSFLAAAGPPQPEYLALKAALSRYRIIASHGGWARIPAGTPEDFEKGEAAAALVQRRLSYEDPWVEGRDLPSAIQRFQLRYGLEPDGRIGPQTLAALNVPVENRILQIAANMERWRWLPRRIEPSAIVINVPDAELSLVLDGKVTLQSRVVVGRPHDPTPILKATGAGITINPPWNVPSTIAGREILPKLKVNPSYLLSQDMVLVNGPAGDPHGLRVNWRAIPAGTFPYRIQQQPGPKNALGTIKVELPNRFDVYLHDTPAKEVFGHRNRDVSHGCVRVQQILPLASYILTASPDAVDRIENAVAEGKTSYIPLQHRLPVYFLYWTAFPDANGNIQFRSDIYGRDERLIAALAHMPKQRLSMRYPNCRKDFRG